MTAGDAAPAAPQGDDYLAGLPEPQVAGWYRRLADRIGEERIDNQPPLASVFLLHYLDNRDPKSTFSFPAPNYLRQSPYVTSVLQYHRAVFLTQEQAHLDHGRRAWAGILPRMQGLSGFTRWDLRAPLELRYESLVEIGSNVVEIGRIQMSGTPQERDLLTSLRGFQLRSRVSVTGARSPNSKVRVTFASWASMVTDRYDFDYSEHFTVPNPDYQSARPDAVRKQDQKIKVYHRNAWRLERAGLAAPYDLQSQEWTVSDARVTAPAEVDPARRL